MLVVARIVSVGGLGSDSALVVGRDCRRGSQLTGFVVPLDSERPKLVLVAAAMMTAEQQLTAIGEDSADVGLSAAAIAAVDGPEWAEDGGGHGDPLGERSDIGTNMKTGADPSR